MGFNFDEKWLNNLMKLKNKNPKKYSAYLRDFQFIMKEFFGDLESEKKKPVKKPGEFYCANCAVKIDWKNNSEAFQTSDPKTNQIETWCSKKCNEARETQR
jgi:hypothetical protein